MASQRRHFAPGTSQLIVLTSLLILVSGQAPNFCTKIADHDYTCDYTGMVSASDRPIAYADFADEPQRLELSANGFLPFFGDTQVFDTGFGSIDQTQFDPNFPATLTIDCGRGGSIFLSAGAFANMSYVQHLKIRNCQNFFIPANIYEDLQDLDSFVFENGLIDDVNPNAMAGLNVEKLTLATHSIPRNMGRFEVRYSPFTDKFIPPGLLFSWKNLTSVALVGADLETLAADAFTYNTKLRYIDLSDNLFTTIPSGIFSGLEMLSDVRMYDINWQCSCANNWFVEYALQQNITLFGDFVCSDGTTVGSYYYSNCVVVDICEGTTGFALLNKCLTLWAMLAFGCALVALVVCIISLVLIILARKAKANRQVRRVKARGRWNKVMDMKMKFKAK